MILVASDPRDVSIRLVREQLDAARAPYVWLDQQRYRETLLAWRASDPDDGELVIGGHRHPLSAFRGVYLRLVAPDQLPGFDQAAVPELNVAHKLEDDLWSWLESTPALVINRRSAQGGNMSKPFHLLAIAEHGFRVPDTLVTSRPEEARAFIASYPAVIYKSAGYVRSIAWAVTADDLDRLDQVRVCPVQFQERVDGADVRVHVVGHDVHSTMITSDAVDYRYGRDMGYAPSVFRPYELPRDMAEKCVSMTAAMGLRMSGIDLKMTPDGDFYCLEVNPSPGYSYCEVRTKQPISASVAALLISADG